MPVVVVVRVAGQDAGDLVLDHLQADSLEGREPCPVLATLHLEAESLVHSRDVLKLAVDARSGLDSLLDVFRHSLLLSTVR